MKAWRIIVIYMLSLVSAFLLVYYVLRLSGVRFYVSPFSDVVPFDYGRVASGPLYVAVAAVFASSVPAIVAGLAMRRMLDRLQGLRMRFFVAAALPIVVALSWSLIVHRGVAWEYQCLWRIASGEELTAALEPCRELALAGLHGVISLCVGSLLAASVLLRKSQGKGVLVDSGQCR